MSYMQKGQGYSLYLFLWGGALLILVVMIIIGRQQKNISNNITSNLITDFTPSSDNIINDLLLSEEDLRFSKKTSFINLVLKNSEQEGEMSQENKEQNIYGLILQQKIRKIRQQKPADFSIQPIPK